MRKSTRVVCSGEAVSYDSDSKQTIPGPVGHRAEIGEAVALAASLFLLQLHFSFVVHFRALCLWRARAGGQLEIRRDCYMDESMLVVDEEAFTAVREAGSWPRSPHSRPAETVRRPTRPGTMALFT
jgi:hypothetical protein